MALLLSMGRSFGFMTSEGPKQVRHYLAVVRDLSVGDFLEAKDLEWRPASPALSAEAAAAYTPKGSLNLSDLAGAVLRSSVSRDSFLSVHDYIKPGESAFLAAVLRPDKRAITIRVDDVTGRGGLIGPRNPGRRDPFRQAGNPAAVSRACLRPRPCLRTCALLPSIGMWTRGP